MNTVPPVVFPAQRPLTRWGVLRRARITLEDGQLVVRLRTRTLSWPLGPGGVASAVHLGGRLCDAASRTGWRGVSNGKIRGSGGCLHLLDGEGRAVACLALGDWLPTGGRPLSLEAPDADPRVGPAPAPADSVERSVLVAFLRHHGVPVHEVPAGQEPPRAPKFAGTLRPGPSWPASPWGLLAFALLVLVLFSWAPPSAEWRNIMASVPFLVVALVCVGSAVLLGLAGSRAGRTTAVAELRPSPGVPVTRGFLARSVLRLTAEAIELRTAQRTLRLIPPPADPVLGVREAVVLEDGGRPWGVALVDGRGTVHAFLHWDTWFAGDPRLDGLGAFCRQSGMGLRRRQATAFPTRRDQDRTARPWRAGDYGTDEHFAYGIYVPWAMAFGLLPFLYGLFVWDVEWTPFFPVLGAAFAVGVLPYLVRGAYRRFSLNALVRPGANTVEHPGGSPLDKQGGVTP